jgi:hypothetical protein
VLPLLAPAVSDDISGLSTIAPSVFEDCAGLPTLTASIVGDVEKLVAVAFGTCFRSELPCSMVMSILYAGGLYSDNLLMKSVVSLR